MGQCTSCLFGSSHDDSPSPETRRRQQAEAAEARQKATEARGVKDPEALKKKMQRREEIEKRAEKTGGEQDGGLRVALDDDYHLQSTLVNHNTTGVSKFGQLGRALPPSESSEMFSDDLKWNVDAFFKSFKQLLL